MIAHIAQCERAEDSIGDRVQPNVCVRVSVESRLSRYRPPAKLERPSRFETVHVKPLTDADALHDTDPIIARTSSRSASVVTLGFG